MVSLKKSMTLGGTRNVAMTKVGQVLANADDPTKSTPAGQPENIAGARGQLLGGLAGPAKCLQQVEITCPPSCYKTGPAGILLSYFSILATNIICLVNIGVTTITCSW